MPLRLAMILTSVLLLVGPTAAAQTVAETVEAFDGGVFVAGGSTADPGAIREVVDDAGGPGALRIAVYDADVADAEGRAAELRQQAGVETVLVFTPTAVAVDSGRYTSAQIDRALGVAGALDPDEAVAAEAIVAELVRQSEPGPPIWPWLLLAVVVVLAAVAGGRLLDRRRRSRAAESAQADASARARASLQAVADEVLRLEAAVTLASDEEVTRDYAEATGRYTALRDRLDRADSQDEVERIGQEIDALSEDLGGLAARVD